MMSFKDALVTSSGIEFKKIQVEDVMEIQEETESNFNYMNTLGNTWISIPDMINFFKKFRTSRGKWVDLTEYADRMIKMLEGVKKSAEELGE